MYLSKKELYELSNMVFIQMCIFDSLDDKGRHRLSKQRQLLEKLYLKLSPNRIKE